MLSALLVRQPHHPSRDAWASRAMRLLAQIPEPQARLRIGMNLLHHHCWLGHFPAAESLVRELRDVARARGVDPLTAIQWGSIETQSHWIAGRVELALRAVDEALEVSRATGIHVWDFMLYTVGINACLLASDLAGAREYLSRVESILPLDRPLHTSQYHQMAALLELHSGHVDAARDHARAAAAAADAAEVAIPQSLTRLTLASALLARRDAEEGRAVLAEALAFARRSGSPFLEFCCLLSEGLHGLRSEDSAQALASLREAFAIAREKGFATNPWLASEALAEACALALEHGVEPEWVREIIRRHRLAPPPDRGDVPGWPWQLEIYTLGRFEIRRDGHPIRYGRKTQRRPLELLKLLVALGGREAGEDFVADVLWSDADGDAARHALESTIYRTRKLLGSDEAIAVREGKIALDPRLCWVDAWAFERSARDAAAPPRGEAIAGDDLLRRALELYRGPFLPGEDEAPQLMAYRGRIERLRQACARAAAAMIGTSHPDAS
jgi:tetratricopeptide (TPR) repeat protein